MFTFVFNSQENWTLLTASNINRKRMRQPRYAAMCLLCPIVLRTSTAEQTTLDEGLHFERRLYHATFGLQDCNKGIDAFLTGKGGDVKWENR